MPKVAVVVLAHGSRGERGASEVPEVLDKLASGLKLLLSSDIAITGAALQFNHPSLEEAVESFIGQGITSFIVAPYFLFPGRHLTEHVPQAIEELKGQHPGTQFIVTENLGLQEYFVELMARRITDAYPALMPNGPLSFGSPQAIEKQSMEVIEHLLPQGLAGHEKTITKRIIHASGDPTVAHLIKFSPSAVKAGINAIGEGATIYTDVRMVASGINKRLADNHRCRVFCALDEMSDAQIMSEPGTRTASAMYSLSKRLNNAIVVVGNAPTALLALTDMVKRSEVAPAIVIGMPVGFVMARESKVELMKCNTPYVTIVGTRGGSSLAAAAVNALLILAGK